MQHGFSQVAMYKGRQYEITATEHTELEDRLEGTTTQEQEDRIVRAFLVEKGYEDLGDVEPAKQPAKQPATQTGRMQSKVPNVSRPPSKGVPWLESAEEAPSPPTPAETGRQPPETVSGDTRVTWSKEKILREREKLLREQEKLLERRTARLENLPANLPAKSSGILSDFSIVDLLKAGIVAFFFVLIATAILVSLIQMPHSIKTPAQSGRGGLSSANSVSR